MVGGQPEAQVSTLTLQYGFINHTTTFASTRYFKIFEETYNDGERVELYGNLVPLISPNDAIQKNESDEVYIWLQEHSNVCIAIIKQQELQKNWWSFIMYWPKEKYLTRKPQ